MSNKNKRRSDLWKFFECLENGIAMCIICRKRRSYKSSISNLSKHLARKHPSVCIVRERENSVNEEQYVGNEVEYVINEGEDHSATEFYLQTQSTVNLTESSVTSRENQICNIEQGLLPTSNQQTTIATYTPVIVRVNKRRKSTLWNHFRSIDDTVAVCNVCKMRLSFKSSISNLKKHLIRKHPEVSIYSETEETSTILPDNCTAVDLQTYSTASMEETPEASGAKKRRQRLPQKCTTLCIYNGTEETPSVMQDNCSEIDSQTHSTLCVGGTPKKTWTQVPSIGEGLSSISQRQTTMVNLVPPKIDINNKSKLDGLLMRLFTHDYQPFSIVEDKGFSELVKALNPAYKLPDREYLSKSLLPAMYEKCIHDVKEKITLQSKSICLTIECWTSIVGESFIAIAAHYIDNEFVLCSVLLECMPVIGENTSENLAYLIKSCVSEWGLTDKILLVISDNVANIESAVIEELSWKHFPCYAHTLNSVMQDALSENHVQMIIQKAKDIVSYFKRNSLACDTLLQHQTQLGYPTPKLLIHEESMWWNSVFIMLCRITELQESVEISLEHLNYDGSFLTESEWEVCEQMCSVLKPFEEATRRMSSDKYMTASEILPLTNGLIFVTNKLKEQQYCDTVKRFVESLNKGMEGRFPSLEYNKIITMSTLLDPRYKLHVFKDSNSAADNVKDYAVDLLTSMITEQEDASESNDSAVCGSFKSGEKGISLWDEFDLIVHKAQPKGTANSKAISEVQRYLDDEILLRNENPLAWWKRHKEIYPHLAELVKLNSCALATSVPCDNIFSSTDNMLNKRRACLGARKAKQLMFLNANLP